MSKPASRPAFDEDAEEKRRELERKVFTKLRDLKTKQKGQDSGQRQASEDLYLSLSVSLTSGILDAVQRSAEDKAEVRKLLIEKKKAIDKFFSDNNEPIIECRKNINDYPSLPIEEKRETCDEVKRLYTGFRAVLGGEGQAWRTPTTSTRSELQATPNLAKSILSMLGDMKASMGGSTTKKASDLTETMRDTLFRVIEGMKQQIKDANALSSKDEEFEGNEAELKHGAYVAWPNGVIDLTKECGAKGCLEFYCLAHVNYMLSKKGQKQTADEILSFLGDNFETITGSLSRSSSQRILNALKNAREMINSSSGTEAKNPAQMAAVDYLFNFLYALWSGNNGLMKLSFKHIFMYLNGVKVGYIKGKAVRNALEQAPKISGLRNITFDDYADGSNYHKYQHPMTFTERRLCTAATTFCGIQHMSQLHCIANLNMILPILASMDVRETALMKDQSELVGLNSDEREYYIRTRGTLSIFHKVLLGSNGPSYYNGYVRGQALNCSIKYLPEDMDLPGEKPIGSTSFPLRTRTAATSTDKK